MLVGVHPRLLPQHVIPCLCLLCNTGMTIGLR